MTTNNTGKSAPAPRRHDVLGIPILGGVLLTIYGFLAYELSSIPADENTALGNVFGIICVAVMLVIHHLWFRPELKSCFSFSFLSDRGLLLFCGVDMLTVLAAVLPGIILGGFAPPTVFTLLDVFAAAFCEEAIFRVLPISVMMRSYKNTGRYVPALLLPALMFGLVHFINLYGGGDVPATILQVFNASIGGIFWAAVYLRSGSIIPSFILHFFLDLIAYMQAAAVEGVSYVTPMELATDGLLDIVELALLFLLLRGRREHIMKVWQNVWGGASSSASQKN